MPQPCYRVWPNAPRSPFGPALTPPAHPAHRPARPPEERIDIDSFLTGRWATGAGGSRRASGAAEGSGGLAAGAGSGWSSGGTNAAICLRQLERAPASEPAQGQSCASSPERPAWLPPPSSGSPRRARRSSSCPTVKATAPPCTSPTPWRTCGTKRQPRRRSPRRSHIGDGSTPCSPWPGERPPDRRWSGARSDARGVGGDLRAQRRPGLPRRPGGGAGHGTAGPERRGSTWSDRPDGERAGRPSRARSLRHPRLCGVEGRYDRPRPRHGGLLRAAGHPGPRVASPASSTSPRETSAVPQPPGPVGRPGDGQPAVPSARRAAGDHQRCQSLHACRDPPRRGTGMHDRRLPRARDRGRRWRGRGRSTPFRAPRPGRRDRAPGGRGRWTAVRLREPGLRRGRGECRRDRRARWLGHRGRGVRRCGARRRAGCCRGAVRRRAPGAGNRQHGDGPCCPHGW